MAFRFTQETPDENLFADVQTINTYAIEHLDNLTDVILSFLSGQGVNEFMANIAGFAESTGANKDILKRTMRGSLIVFKGAIRATLAPLQLKDDLVNLGVSEDRAILIAKKWKAFIPSLSRAVAGKTLMVNQVLDMEWRFGVTAANSEMKKVGETFLQLRLILDKGNKKTETVHMELTLPQFYQFLHEMEAAKAHLDFFS